MKTTHLRHGGYSSSAWSGGVTTQLYIYPPEGDYSKRQFAVRISSASVDLDESDFTPLPGVTRYITPLKGGFTLTHPGRDGVTMGPLARPYRFMGDWETHCAGKAVDFNLMLKGAEGFMDILEGGAGLKEGLNFIFPICGGRVEVGSEAFILEPGDMLAVELDGGEAARAVFDRAIFCHAEIK